LLTKYEAIESDYSANQRVLRRQLIDFEKDAALLKDPVLAGLQTILGEYSVQSVTKLPDHLVYIISKRVVHLVDDFYFKNKSLCLYSTERDPTFLGIWHSLVSLFRPVATSHLRHYDATQHFYHLGIGAGLLIHEGTLSLDPRIAATYLPLQALYLSPGSYYDNEKYFQSDEAYRVHLGPADYLKNPLTRKLNAISGVDTYTILAKDYPLIQNTPDIEIIPSRPRLI
jgi:hypothetical protein